VETSHMRHLWPLYLLSCRDSHDCLLQHLRGSLDIIDPENQHRALDLRDRQRVGLIRVDSVLDVSDFIPEQIIGRTKTHANITFNGNS